MGPNPILLVYLPKRGNVDTEIHTGKMSHVRKVGLLEILPSQLSEGTHWSWISSLQNCETGNFCGLRHPDCGTLLW